MGSLKFITDGDAIGRIAATFNGEVIGTFDGYKNIATVGLKDGKFTFSGQSTISEATWRAKIHFLADRLNSDQYWRK